MLRCWLLQWFGKRECHVGSSYAWIWWSGPCTHACIGRVFITAWWLRETWTPHRRWGKDRETWTSLCSSLRDGSGASQRKRQRTPLLVESCWDPSCFPFHLPLQEALSFWYNHHSFYILVAGHCMWDLSSPTRDWTCSPLWWKHRVLTPGTPGKSHDYF